MKTKTMLLICMFMLALAMTAGCKGSDFPREEAGAAALPSPDETTPAPPTDTPVPPTPVPPTDTPVPPTDTPTPTPTPVPPPVVVVAVFPVDGDEGVPPGTPLKIEFASPVDAASVEAAFSLEPTVEGEVVWEDETRFSFLPAPGSWAEGTPYTATLSTEARTIEGGALESPFAVRFRWGYGDVPIPILMYHAILELEPYPSAEQLEWTVPPDSFVEQMAYLPENGYHTVYVTQLLAYLQENAPLPPKPVALTFDDAHYTFKTAALPVLLRHGHKSTLFVVTNYAEWNSSSYMTWDDIKAARDVGVDVQSHTESHPALTKLSQVEAETEIRDSKVLLDTTLGQNTTILSYPYGAYNGAVVDTAVLSGYTAAVTINPTYLQQRDAPYQLNRIHIPYEGTIEDFAALLPR